MGVECIFLNGDIVTTMQQWVGVGERLLSWNVLEG